MQPIGEATGEEASKKFEEEELEEKEDESVGEIAKTYLNTPILTRDTTFGIRKIDGHHYIGHTHVIIKDNDIIIDDKKFEGTPGLWKLIMLKEPSYKDFTNDDYKHYGRILVKTYVLHHRNDPYSPYPKGSGGKKWLTILSDIWEKRREFYGKGVVIMPSNPNALLERLDLLLASQEAGHTGVRNELVSICDELKRQGVLDVKAYKKLNSIIKNDSA